MIRTHPTMDQIHDCLPEDLRRQPTADLRAIIEATDLVALIGESLTLRKAGHDFEARCPFHDEKSPSFTVSREKQFYHCFGCGAHGDALDWMQQHERMNFRQALEALAGRALIIVQQDRGETRKRRAVAMQAEIEAAAWPEVLILEQAMGERVSYRGIDAQTRARYPHIHAVPNGPGERERLAAKRLAVALWAIYGAKA